MSEEKKVTNPRRILGEDVQQDDKLEQDGDVQQDGKLEQDGDVQQCGKLEQDGDVQQDDRLEQDTQLDDNLQKEEPTYQEGGMADGVEYEENFHFLEESIKRQPIYRRIKWIPLAKWLGNILIMVGLVFGLLQWQGKSFVTNEEKTSSVVSIKKEEVQVITETTYQVVEMEPESLDELARRIQQAQDKGKAYIVQLKGLQEEETWTTNPDGHMLRVGLLLEQNQESIYILGEGSHLINSHHIQGMLSTNNIYPCEIVGYDEDLDIALFKMDKTSFSEKDLELVHSLAPLSQAYPAVGSSVYSIGNPLGHPDTFASGIVSGNFQMTDTWDDRYQMVTLQIPISQTGSGVITNVEGTILGWIAPSKLQGNIPGHVSALTLRHLQEIATSLKREERIPYIGIKVRYMTASDQIANHMPVGLYIEEVAEGTPAFLAGIQPGDIITKINDKINLTQEGLNQLLLEAKSQGVWEIHGQRISPKGYTDIAFNVNLEVVE